MKKFPPARPTGWRDFGQFLFEQREADPGYYVITYLRRVGYDPAQLKRFAVAWCVFYNLGIAARASELIGRRFYEYLLSVYPTAKRASERRHFRGAAGLKALAQWQAKWPKPEGLADWITGHIEGKGTPDMGDIRERCNHVAQMGDYFKWKWGDLTEVLGQQPVDFRGWVKHSPKVPVEGARLIEDAEHWCDGPFNIGVVYEYIVAEMRKRNVKSYYAPWRDFDVQDAETICCVYKQYLSGSYIPGLRTAKAFARLHHDGDGSETAKEATRLLLKKQPQPMFRSPPTLAQILHGDLNLKIEDLLL